MRFHGPASGKFKKTVLRDNSRIGRRDAAIVPRWGAALLRPYKGYGLRAIAGVDADIFRGEIAGPVTGDGAAGVKIHDDRDVLGEQAVAGGALVEVERLAAAQDANAGHGDFHARGVEGYAGAACGGEDAAPVGVGSSEGRFD